MAAMLVAVATAGLAAAPVEARAPRQHTVHVEADLYDPGATTFTNPALDCGPDRAGVCGLVWEGVTSWTGDWKGTTTYRARGYMRPGEPGRWEVWETFTGTVEGCGTGKLSWYGTGTIDFTKFDPATQSVPIEGTFRLVGPGEGGLEGIKGTVTATARAYAVPLLAQRGSISGDVTCHKRR